jgi:hypothetical protein
LSLLDHIQVLPGDANSLVFAKKSEVNHQDSNYQDFNLS